MPNIADLVSDPVMAYAIVVSLRYKYPILGNLTESQKYDLKW
jgi:hypothetical protein